MAAKYRRIADAYRVRLINQEIPPGGKLPTEPEIGAEFGVSIGTVRSALALLQGEGLIWPDSPRGWFARRKEHMTYRPQSDGRTLASLANPEPWVQQILAEGREPSQTIDIAIVVPPPEIAERLNLQEGASAALRQRLRFINGNPVNIADSYYPLWMVEGSAVLSPNDVPEGISRVLRDLGYVQARAVDEIEVRMANPREQERLHLGPGTPVAAHRATTFTTEGQPVRCSVNILPGDQHLIVYEREWDPNPAGSSEPEESR